MLEQSKATEPSRRRAALDVIEGPRDTRSEAEFCQRVLRKYSGKAKSQQAALNIFKKQLGWIKMRETGPTSTYTIRE